MKKAFLSVTVTHLPSESCKDTSESPRFNASLFLLLLSASSCVFGSKDSPNLVSFFSVLMCGLALPSIVWKTTLKTTLCSSSWSSCLSASFLFLVFLLHCHCVLSFCDSCTTYLLLFSDNFWQYGRGFHVRIADH